MTPSTLNRRIFLIQGSVNQTLDTAKDAYYYDSYQVAGYALAGKKGVGYRTMSCPYRTSLSVGNCGSRTDPSLSYFGISGVQGPVSLRDEYYSYFGPRGKVSYFGQQPYNRLLEVKQSARPSAAMYTIKSASQSTQIVDYDGPALMYGHPSLQTVVVSGKYYVYPSLGFLDSYAVATATRLRETQLEVLNKALEKCSVADIGETLAEMLNLRHLLAAFGKNVLRDIPNLLRSDLLSRGGVIKFLDSLASLQLSWSYALRPMIDVYNDLVSNVNKLAYAKEKKRLVISAEKVHEIGRLESDSYMPQFSGGTVGPISGFPDAPTCYLSGPTSTGGGVERVVHITGQGSHQASSVSVKGQLCHSSTLKVEQTCKMEIEMYADLSAWAMQLGLNNPIRTSWQIFPASFIIDTVINIGKWTKNFAYTGGFDISNQNVVSKLHFQTTTSFGSFAESLYTHREQRGSISGDSLYFTYKASTPWSSALADNPIKTGLLNMESGKGIPDLTEREDLFALFYLLSRALYEVQTHGVHLLSSRERRKYRKLRVLY